MSVHKLVIPGKTRARELQQPMLDVAIAFRAVGNCHRIRVERTGEDAFGAFK